MKLVGALSTVVLSLTLGSIPAHAQQDRHDQHDQKDEHKTKPAAGKEKKAGHAKPARQEEKRAESDKNARREERSTKQENKSVQQENRREEKNSQRDERNAQQRRAQQAKPERQAERDGRRGGGRIPEERYRAHFGREHRFRVSEGDYRRNRRFQYGGYSFGFVQPWPSNWLYTEDVFVVEIDGVYYLCNANYPGVNIVLSLNM